MTLHACQLFDFDLMVSDCVQKAEKKAVWTMCYSHIELGVPGITKSWFTFSLLSLVSVLAKHEFIFYGFDLLKKMKNYVFILSAVM